MVFGARGGYFFGVFRGVPGRAVWGLCSRPGCFMRLYCMLARKDYIHKFLILERKGPFRTENATMIAK